MTAPQSGSPLVACPRCRQPAPAGSRFCPACGGSLSGGGAAARGPATKALPWILGSALVLALVALVFKPGTQAPAAPAAAVAPAGGGGAPPDLTNMTPRERFDRLYSRVITAAQTGDQATVEQFTPMAIAAFGMLDSATADARYHLAMIELHIGDLAAAQAQADSVKLGDANHLLGYVIGGAVAQWTKDQAALKANYEGFLKHYDAEMAKNRPEYVEHKETIEKTLKAAKGEAPTA
ncbi:MAG: hypothetical protein AB7S39_07755 [Gemmatimonadales bacterium]